MDPRSRVRDAIEGTPMWALVATILLLHVMLSVWQAWFVQLNDDGILYVHAAHQFLRGDFAGGRASYGWFAFPLLIATASKLTTLSPEVAGKAINLLASTTTLCVLLRMSWMQASSKLTLCAVAALVFGNYAWNDARGALTRDHLFICFVVLSFYLLFLDRRSSNFFLKVGFAIACVCASLMRKEAAALLVMAPALLIVFGNGSQRLRMLALAVFTIAAAGVVFAVAYQVSGGMTNLIAAPKYRMAILGDQVLKPFASRRAPLGYSAMIIGLVIGSLISSLGPLSIILTGWGLLKSAALRHSNYMRLFTCYLCTASVALSAQTFFALVFEVRYGLFLGLLLAVPAAIVPTMLIPSNELRDRRIMVLGIVAAIWLVYGLLGGLKLGDASRFNLEAGAWLRQHVPPGAVSLSNNNQISYYGGLASPVPDPDFLLSASSGNENISTLRKYANYDVVVLRLRKDQLDQVAALNPVIGKKPSAEFENARGDKILIYEPRKPAP